MMRRVSAPMLAVALCAAALGACGSARTLDTASLQKSIVHTIAREHGIDTTVSCPHGIPVEAGRRFSCVARLAAGSYRITAVERDGAGHVRYENSEPLLVLDTLRVEHSIEGSVVSQRHLQATVQCPSPVLRRAGVRFYCTAKVAGSTRPDRFVARVVAADGRVRYAGV